ncbi:MAG TPA: ABC transporter permease [Syntrophobacteraceae bacterium]|nr:ABC transporter permease [Syntrophobacteraceae bacterium]
MRGIGPGTVSRRFFRVWQRNFLVYRRIWKINFLPPLLEPFFYLLAFGVGLSGLVGNVSYGGKELSYAAFITPALLAINMMQNAFFENTYASFVRMYYQKTFDAMMATPLSLQEVILAEIIWGATKSFFATGVMLGVVSLFGLVHYPHGLLILPLSFLAGIAFGSMGMLFTGIVPSIDLFNLPVFLFITPMFLFSGTFFPLDALPSWAQYVAMVLPLTHLVEAIRRLCVGELPWNLLWGLGYLVLLCALFLPLSTAVMHRRLIH